MGDNNAPDLSILGDRLTLHPAGVVQDQETPLLTSYARFRSAPLDFLREVSLHLSGTGWRSYDDFIGRNIFYNGFSDHIKALVLKNPRLQSKISELAHKRLDVELAEGTLPPSKVEDRRREMKSQLIQVADSWTDQMICKMDSRRFIRGAYYFATQLLTRAYHQGIHVSSEEVLRLRKVAKEAEKKKQSIIFLPCHRSHVDYVSLQLICYRLGLALPIVVAGDNLNFPAVGYFLQHAGAMWIRRSFGDDALYTTLVQAYLDTLLQEGHNFECFVEGGRSRTGKLLQPKFGILSFLLESVLSGQVEDAIICPVSTQYDKVIEVDSYISELLGQPKPKESLGNFLSSSSVLSLKLGRVDVRFHEPWSLRDFINEQQVRLTTLPPRMKSPEDIALKRRLLTTLGYKVLSDINAVSVVMPTALVGTVLLTLRGRGVGKSELVRRVDWLTERVKKQGGRVAHFSGLPTTVVVERALEVLGQNLVGEYKNLPEKTYYAADRFQLSFYRNMTIHLFVSEALVSAALYTVKIGESISYEQLYQTVFFLSQLFRGEFIFPTTPLAENLSNTLTGLESDNIITVQRSENDGNAIESISLNDDFYCFLIWPFIEASWLGAISLLMLTPPSSKASQQTSLPLNAVVTQAQRLGKTLYAQGDISYLEAVNRETLRNAYTRFAESGIISISSPSKDGKIPAAVHLTSGWMPKRTEDGHVEAQGKLWEYCESISKARRGGDDRRDGNVKRIFGLVELVGAGLWKDIEPAKVALPVKGDAEWKAKRREIRTAPKL
ncbi:acyltransferase [Aureobasidium sp. EXF-8845]|nr:acyltransferase [Aureobasidium sp. EXF-8845]KAI4851457.1 acyltransferase [Aureobasidium sp. EXF-8846]